MHPVSDQFHYHSVPVQRSAGESLVDKIAYAARIAAYDERTGTRYDYTREKSEVLATKMAGMKCSPEEFANRIQTREKASNAVLAHNVDASLPWQLGTRNAEVLELFCQRVHERWGLPVFAALQKAPKRKKKLKSGEEKSLAGDARNFHAHLLIGLRAIDEKGNWSKEKFRGFDKNFGQQRDIEAIVECRKLWAECVNEKLEQYAYAERWTHLSYAARGIDQEGGVHLGQAATYAERTGKVTKRGERNRRVKARNAARKAAKTAPAPEKTSAGTEKNPAESAARPPAVEPATKPVTKQATVHAPTPPNPSHSLAPTSTKPTRKKLTANDRERILDRLEQTPALTTPYAQRNRERVRASDDRKREADRAAQSRRSRGGKVDETQREIERREQQSALAVAAADSAANRTRRARGAKHERDRLAAKAAAKKAAQIQAKAEEIKEQAAQQIAEAAPQINVLSLFDQLGKGGPRR